MEQTIIKAIEDALSEVTGRPVGGIQMETRFDRDLDLDSYLFVQFLLALEDKVPGLRFDPDAIGQTAFNVASGLVGYIVSRAGTQPEYADA